MLIPLTTLNSRSLGGRRGLGPGSGSPLGSLGSATGGPVRQVGGVAFPVLIGATEGEDTSKKSANMSSLDLIPSRRALSTYLDQFGNDLLDEHSFVLQLFDRLDLVLSLLEIPGDDLRPRYPLTGLALHL